MVWVNVFNRIFSYFRVIDKSVVNLKNDVKLFEIDIFPKKLGRGKEALSLSRKRAEIKKKTTIISRNYKYLLLFPAYSKKVPFY